MRLLFLILAFTMSLSLSAQQKNKQQEDDAKAIQEAAAALFSSAACPVADSYAFDHSFTSRVQNWNKQGTMDNNVLSRNLMNADATLLGITVLESNTRGMPPATIIMDLEAQNMISLIQQGSSKMAMCMSMDNPMFKMAMQAQAKDQEAAPAAKAPQRTGRTREILGYTCEEWTSEDEDMRYQFWVSKDTALPMSQYYQALTRHQGPMAGWNSALPFEGMVLLTEGKSLRTEERMRMEVLDIQAAKKEAISTKGYQR